MFFPLIASMAFIRRFRRRNRELVVRSNRFNQFLYVSTLYVIILVVQVHPAIHDFAKVKEIDYLHLCMIRFCFAVHVSYIYSLESVTPQTVRQFYNFLAFLGVVALLVGFFLLLMLLPRPGSTSKL